MKLLEQFKEWRQKRADRQNAKELLAILIHIRDNLHNAPSYGICPIVSHCAMTNQRGKDYERMMRQAWVHWEHYSGCESFPVPHPYYPKDGPKPKMAAAIAYWDFSRWHGPYGHLRIMLLQYLIRYFQGRL